MTEETKKTTTAIKVKDDNSLVSLLEKAKPRFQAVAPKYLKVERMIRLLLAAGSRNPKILLCSKDSVLLFCMKCAETGLEPIGAGGAWPIPFENKKAGTYELTFMPDYRGLVNCAKRSEAIKDAFSEVVRENDEFDYELGMNPSLTHKPARGDRGALQCAYCIITFPDDTKRFIVMDAAEIEAIRDRSQAWRAFIQYKKECPWNTDPAEMHKKTVTKRAMKQFSGLSQQLDSAIEADNQVDGIAMDSPRLPVAMPKALPDPGQEAPAGETRDFDPETGEVIPPEVGR